MITTFSTGKEWQAIAKHFGLRFPMECYTISIQNQDDRKIDIGGYGNFVVHRPRMYEIYYNGDGTCLARFSTDLLNKILNMESKNCDCVGGCKRIEGCKLGNKPKKEVVSPLQEAQNKLVKIKELQSLIDKHTKELATVRYWNHSSSFSFSGSPCFIPLNSEEEKSLAEGFIKAFIQLKEKELKALQNKLIKIMSKTTIK